jgi:polar amino acid transport system substrate-binding protein
MKCISRFNKYILTTLVIFLSLIYTCAHASERSSPKQFRAIAAPFPPFTDPDNDDLGLAWEVCRAALESQEYEVSIAFVPWARALLEAKDGHYDGLLPAYRTEERETDFLYSEPLTSISIGLLKHRARIDIKYDNDLTHLKGLKIGVGRGYSTSKEFDRADYLDKYEVTATHQILKMLWLGRLDLAVGGIEYSKHYLKTLSKNPEYGGIADDIVVVGSPLATRDIHLIISKKVKNAQQKLADLNQGLKKIIADGTYDRIVSKYSIYEVDIGIPPREGDSTARGSRHQLDALEPSAPLRITTSMTSPLSKDDQTGFYDQVLLEAFRRAGQPVHIAHLPTERSITNADLGITDGEFPRISGLSRLYPNLQLVPEKIVDFEFVAFTWRPDIQIADWSSCAPYNVAIVTGWKILEANLADAKSLTKVKNQEILFTLLAERRADIVVYSRFEGYEMIRKLGLQSVRALEPPLAKREMFLYLNKEHLPLIPEIAKQLRSLKEDGTYDRILKKTLGPYSMTATEGSDGP